MLQAINTQQHEPQLAVAGSSTDTTSAAVPESQSQVTYCLIVCPPSFSVGHCLILSEEYFYLDLITIHSTVHCFYSRPRPMWPLFILR